MVAAAADFEEIIVGFASDSQRLARLPVIGRVDGRDASGRTGGYVATDRPVLYDRVRMALGHQPRHLHGTGRAGRLGARAVVRVGGWTALPSAGRRLRVRIRRQPRRHTSGRPTQIACAVLNRAAGLVDAIASGLEPDLTAAWCGRVALRRQDGCPREAF